MVASSTSKNFRKSAPRIAVITASAAVDPPDYPDAGRIIQRIAVRRKRDLLPVLPTTFCPRFSTNISITTLPWNKPRFAAETDPYRWGGFDPKYKLTIIAAHLWFVLKPDTILNVGIQYLSQKTWYSVRQKKKDYKIKLRRTSAKVDLATVTLFVMPQIR